MVHVLKNVAFFGSTGVILEPDSNAKAPMVRKPVHMIKPRVITLQSLLHNSLERRKQGSVDTSSHASLTKSKMDSAPLTQGERTFGSQSTCTCRFFCDTECPLISTLQIKTGSLLHHAWLVWIVVLHVCVYSVLLHVIFNTFLLEVWILVELLHSKIVYWYNFLFLWVLDTKSFKL